MVRATLNSKFELEELKPTNSLSEIHQLIDAISVEILSHFVIRDNHFRSLSSSHERKITSNFADGEN